MWYSWIFVCNANMTSGYVRFNYTRDTFLIPPKKILVCLLNEAEREGSRCGAVFYKLGHFSRPGLESLPDKPKQHITLKKKKSPEIKTD